MPFACAGVKGGDTWWRPHPDGLDSAAMVSDELTAELERLNLDVSRPALYGYSMGGVGAIYLAENTWRGRLSSVVIASTPFFSSYDESMGAYGSAAEFAAYEIRSRWGNLQGTPVRVDIGDRDPFLQQNTSFLAPARPSPELHIRPGGHDPAFWSGVALEQLRFVAAHL
ncbi:hypothetical protein [Arsenicicoccus dermatophilus]|uniref:hypothetical protein n=1 Tax=Arsenicicoccus dermatophilus TaxID=1076331 RepID=UPI0038918DDE